MTEDTTRPDEQDQDDAAPEGADANDAFTDSVLVTLTEERDKYLELARRTQAEFENYQKRVRRDAESERKYAALPILNDLLPVLDNLERALQSPPADENAAQFVEGIRLLHKQWLTTLAKHGVDRINAVGSPFDPNLHEAIMQQPSEEHPPMTVLMETRSGYTLHERVLRPAQVIVAAAPAKTE